jgi:hypothetical protein
MNERINLFLKKYLTSWNLKYNNSSSQFLIYLCAIFSHTHTVRHLDIIKVFYSPTDAQVNRLKNNFKIYIKIDIKTAPTCFGAVTPSPGSTLLVLNKVTVVKIAN